MDYLMMWIDGQHDELHAALKALDQESFETEAHNLVANCIDFDIANSDGTNATGEADDMRAFLATVRW